MADITVYGAPWCPDCKRAKQFLNEQRVPYDWVDVDADPEGLAFVEGLQDGGRTIPTIVFKDGSHLLEPTNAELAEKLGLELRADRSAFDLVIVGGGPAGLSAAIYAAREGMDALVIEKSGLGGQAGVTERIDNYPGFVDGISGAELAQRLADHARRYAVTLLSAVEVTGIRRDETLGGHGMVIVDTSAGDSYCADAVLLATGSRYRRLGIEGEDELIGAGIHFCATCDGPFYRGSDELLVVGGGNSALEEALFLTKYADRVRIVARSGIAASALVADKVRNHPGITIHTNTDVLSITGRPGKLESVTARDRESGEELTFRPAGAFVFVGLDPNTGPFAHTIDLDERGFIVTDGAFATSIDGVFAAGDVRAGATRQVGSAVGEGIAALLSIRSFLERQHLRSEHKAEGPAS